MPLKVAIVGRPNVGKSTLFNRLAGKKLAIVNDQPGVTRDRREAEGRLGDLALDLIDTAGFEDVDDESLQSRMRTQTERAIEDADLCLFVIDGREGVTSLDRIFAGLVRRRNRPVILLANKAEGKAADVGAGEAFALGLGEPILISAEHGEGLAELYAAVIAFAPAQDTPTDGFWEGEDDTEALDGGPDEARPVRIAIVGRPNAGKSTLVNRLIGEDRLLTGPEAGITRDAIPVDWTYQGRAVRLVDTAGLRRRARVQETLEKLSTSDAIRAITFAEVVILVMDAQNAFETQDMQIADLVEREGRGLVFCLAKWDLVEDPQQRLEVLRETAERMLPQVRGTPLIPLSAETGRGVDRLMPAVFATHAHWSTKVKTRDLNDWLAMAVQRHPPPAVNGRRIKPKYMAQLKGRPPTFVLFASRADHLPEQYRRYLINSLRESFDLPGVPIRITVKSNKNPYADESDGNRKQPRGRFADSVRAPPKPSALAAQGGVRQGSGGGQVSRPDLAGDALPESPRPTKPAKATKPRARPMAPAKAGAAQRGGGGSGAKKPQVRAKGGRNANRIPTTHKLRKPRPPRRTSPPKS